MPAGTRVPHVEGFEIVSETDVTYVVSRPGYGPRLRLHVLFAGYRTGMSDGVRRNVTGGVPLSDLDEVRRRLDLVAEREFGTRGEAWSEGHLGYEVAGDASAWPHPVLRADMADRLSCSYEIVPVTFGLSLVGEDDGVVADGDVDMMMGLEDLRDELEAYAERGLI